MALTRLCLALFPLFFLAACTPGQRYQTHQQLQRHPPQQQQRRHGNHYSFSPTCRLGEDGEVLCDQCQPGYTGPRCDR